VTDSAAYPLKLKSKRDGSHAKAGMRRRIRVGGAFPNDMVGRKSRGEATAKSKRILYGSEQEFVEA
jgi:hypothetical protein